MWVQLRVKTPHYKSTQSPIDQLVQLVCLHPWEIFKCWEINTNLAKTTTFSIVSHCVTVWVGMAPSSWTLLLKSVIKTCVYWDVFSCSAWPAALPLLHFPPLQVDHGFIHLRRSETRDGEGEGGEAFTSVRLRERSPHGRRLPHLPRHRQDPQRLVLFHYGC